MSMMNDIWDATDKAASLREQKNKRAKAKMLAKQRLNEKKQ